MFVIAEGIFLVVLAIWFGVLMYTFYLMAWEQYLDADVDSTLHKNVEQMILWFTILSGILIVMILVLLICIHLTSPVTYSI